MSRLQSWGYVLCLCPPRPILETLGPGPCSHISRSKIRRESELGNRAMRHSGGTVGRQGLVISETTLSYLGHHIPGLEGKQAGSGSSRPARPHVPTRGQPRLRQVVLPRGHQVWGWCGKVVMQPAGPREPKEPLLVGRPSWRVCVQLPAGPCLCVTSSLTPSVFFSVYFCFCLLPSWSWSYLTPTLRVSGCSCVFLICKMETTSTPNPGQLLVLLCFLCPGIT